jgi:hypothetical protein
MPSILLSGRLQGERRDSRGGSKPLPSREEIRERKKALMEKLRIEVEFEAGRVDSQPLSRLWGGPDPRGGGRPLTMENYNPFED